LKYTVGETNISNFVPAHLWERRRRRRREKKNTQNNFRFLLARLYKYGFVSWHVDQQ